jgi:hypothetical protein
MGMAGAAAGTIEVEIARNKLVIGRNIAASVNRRFPLQGINVKTRKPI